MKSYEIAYDLLYEDIYKNFITEAINRSDVLTIDVYWPSEEFMFFDKEMCMMCGMSEALYNSRYKHEQKKYLREKKIFDTNCMDYLKKLEPYLLNNGKFSRNIETYHLKSSKDLIPILQEPGSLDAWGFPNYPDNIAFYKNEEPWFYCTNHGTSNADFVISSKSEYDFWKELGILFLSEFSNC